MDVHVSASTFGASGENNHRPPPASSSSPSPVNMKRSLVRSMDDVVADTDQEGSVFTPLASPEPEDQAEPPAHKESAPSGLAATPEPLTQVNQTHPGSGSQGGSTSEPAPASPVPGAHESPATRTGSKKARLVIELDDRPVREMLLLESSSANGEAPAQRDENEDQRLSLSSSPPAARSRLKRRRAASESDDDYAPSSAGSSEWVSSSVHEDTSDENVESEVESDFASSPPRAKSSRRKGKDVAKPRSKSQVFFHLPYFCASLARSGAV
ncbi:uncharacterized protein E0L32_011372 [Thyridium curvatum]|uniref:Uncharacterized protein n=1 Tax=Thyridium curvatum TaxID=1093900 RepID=A0A507BN67_9PEZI|nr:uncharacterized protein E0L32_011372 [Thyridium curvatum]TPX18979.1 hypothetical protein E0L32_011372 [Thyridium curvatum]